METPNGEFLWERFRPTPQGRGEWPSRLSGGVADAAGILEGWSNFEWRLRGRKVWHAGVRFRLSICSLLFAWLCASGGLLDLTQVFAWARMCAGYAQAMPMNEAVSRTFDPGKPCEICMAILKARKATEDRQAPLSAAATAEFSKVVLFAADAGTTVAAPACEAWPAGVSLWAEVRVEPVPVPPPRGGAGQDIV